MGAWRDAGYSREMHVTVRVRGGVMGDDRATSIRGDQLIVTDHGKVRANRRLAPGDASQVERLANEVAGLTISEQVHQNAVDGGITTVEIAANKTNRIELWAGDDAPEQVWALLDAVEALARETE